MALPLDDEKVLTYVASLFSRGLQSRTISTYLAGLRQIHLAQGILIPVLRPEIVKQLLTCQQPGENQVKIKPKGLKAPCNYHPHETLEDRDKESQDSKEMKRLQWAIATILFNGAFRIHELLSRTERQFDPCFTLLSSDLKIKTLKINNSNSKIIQIIQI